jgi:uncharacterized membrane protein YhfC
MLSSLTLTGMVIQVIVALALLMGAFMYLRKKERISWKPLLIGAAVFFVFSQVLEKLLHLYILQINPATVALLKNV